MGVLGAGEMAQSIKGYLSSMRTQVNLQHPCNNAGCSRLHLQPQPWGSGDWRKPWRLLLVAQV